MASTQIATDVVPPDTQAALLLCGTFVKGRSPDAKPLTPQEYNALALWLVRQGRRPADLLSATDELLSTPDPALPRPTRIRALLGRGVQMAAALDRWQNLGLWVVGRGEDRYPERLRRHLRSAAPVLLYGAGDMALLDRRGLAVVGSRNIDEEGCDFTRRVAERCAAAGIQVVSGGARGVDQAAVSAALEAGGGAVAVLADRLDRAATSRDAKEALRRGALTLVTPFEPESPFAVGKAMGRNKHIYALANWALVVRFTPGEGGTWAGAVEQLGQNKRGPTSIPVFVRVAGNPEAGWQELRSRGALPFPEQEFWKSDVCSLLAVPEPRAQDLFQSAAAAPVESQEAVTATPVEPSSRSLPPGESTASQPSVPAQTEPDDCYTRCLPLLLMSLRGEPGERQLSGIAEKLGILLPQLKKWLGRAIEEGKVQKPKKKGKYIYLAASAADEPLLFDRGGDAA